MVVVAAVQAGGGGDVERLLLPLLPVAVEALQSPQPLTGHLLGPKRSEMSYYCCCLSVLRELLLQKEMAADGLELLLLMSPGVL